MPTHTPTPTPTYFLQQITGLAASRREQGDLLERLVQHWLENAAPHKDEFKKVSLWREWAAANSVDRTDTGIDLVGETREGELCAVQCKFYTAAETLNLGNLSNFLASVNSTVAGKKFASGLIVSTTPEWSGNLEVKARDSNVLVRRMDFTNELASAQVNWKAACALLPETDFTYIDVTPQAPMELDDQVGAVVDLSALLEKILPKKSSAQTKRKSPLRHQRQAIKDVVKGLQTENATRGKLIMACGTGKTYTALKIAEKLARKSATNNGNILFLVPSLSLLSQALFEWSKESEQPLRNFAVCSDAKVGKDEEDISIHDLAIPATTDSAKLGEKLREKTDRRNVVFATYHSIDVVATAQKQHGAPKFDLVICDEAHRTTGVEGGDKNRSYFTRVHDADYLVAAKRLYMTATPRLYAATAKARAKEYQYQVYSMDDPTQYGEELHRFDFSEAVNARELSDYKVIIVTLKEDRKAEERLDEYHEFSMEEQTGRGKKYEIGGEDLAKIIGCWKGLAKETEQPELLDDARPMRRAVAFSNTINQSKAVTNIFPRVIADYQASRANGAGKSTASALQCEMEHVDGRQNALVRNKNLNWLKEEPEENCCRILSNVRCLSEGVDVPALDAVLFLNPRKSKVDIVQSVGRVMRKAPDKTYGYIILPVLIPADQGPEEAMDNNDAFQVVWQTVNALRSHDSRLDIEINQFSLNQKSERIVVIDGNASDSDAESGAPPNEGEPDAPMQMRIDFSEWQNAIFARILKHCGDRQYWDTWASEVAAISKRVTERLQALLKAPAMKTEFGKFVSGLRKNINPAITESAALEMLSQHIISRRIFEILFDGDAFAQKNPVSKTIQAILKKFGEKEEFAKETKGLESFYQSVDRSVQHKIEGVDNALGIQKIISELYEKFFKRGFPKMQESLGIVYTPVEVVDFIIASIDDLLKQEFQRSGIGAKNVNFLDPFTGTGTFVTRLLQSARLKPTDLPRKYQEEIHANEIVLLAYYIAAVNIEKAYQERTATANANVQSTYIPFDGIALTDTFQIDERDESKAAHKNIAGVASPLAENDKRIRRQQNTPITVVFGNPPYSAGQKSANDDNPNLKYEKLDASIAESYAKHTSVTNKNSLYDSYIRAIRWASNRIEGEGIVAFISNNSYIDGNAMDGLRKCLNEEFSKIYCFNLRGNQRTSGEISQREGGKIFGSGSRAGIAILFLVKNANAKGDCQIRYYDIGDYHNREEKLGIIADFGSVRKIPWQSITQDKNNDWINQQNEEFDAYLPIGDKENKRKSGSVLSLFTSFSSGVKTGRDAWAYNFSQKEVAKNIQRMIAFYNSEVDRYAQASSNGKHPNVDSFVDYDPTKISWDREIKNDLKRGKHAKFTAEKIRIGLNRPFCQQHCYFDRQMNQMIYLQPSLFPTPKISNRAICVSGIGGNADFSALLVDRLPDLSIVSASQCFPRYTFAPSESDAAVDGYERVDNIPPATLTQFREHYANEKVTGDDIFYYVYGVLHNPEYKRRFAADLKKTLPRIPFAQTLADFRTYAQAGKALADLHTNYENANPYPLKVQHANAQANLANLVGKENNPTDAQLYRVEKMKYAKSADKSTDKTRVIYNPHITLANIPEAAQRYIVNGKPAIDWVIDRYSVKTDRASGITNDPNQWSDDPEYIINLFRKVVTVSVETMEVVDGLPGLFEG